MSFAFYYKLLAQLPPCLTKGITIVAGNGLNTALVKFKIFVVFLYEMLIFHDFKIVDILSLDVVKGGEIMRF